MSVRATGARERAADDAGSAVVEFCFLGVLLMVPLVYVMLAVFQVQGAAYAVASATREAGRAFTTTDGSGDADARAFQAASVAMSDHGVDLGAGQMVIACGADPCLTAGASVRTTIEVEVPLPFLPAVFGDVVPASVRVEGTHVAHVDRFREGP